MIEVSFFIGSFNSREQALIIWIAIFFVLILSKKEIRTSFLGIFKILLHRTFLFVFSALFLYLALVIFIFSKIGIWSTTLVPETIFWFFGSALVLLFGVNNATHNSQFFKKIVLDNLKIILVIIFIVNIYTYHLVIEMIILPITLLVVAISTYGGTKKEYLQVKKLADFVLVAFGIFLIIFALSRVVSNFQDFVTLENIQSFTLPTLLTFAYLPLLYAFAIFITYETLFIRLNIFTKENKQVTYFAKRKILTLCHLNLWKLNRFAKASTQELMKLGTRSDVLTMIEKFNKN